MTDATQELEEWKAAKQPLLDRWHCRPVAYALGLATMAEVDGEERVIEVRYFPSAVNVCDNQLSLAIIDEVIFLGVMARADVPVTHTRTLNFVDLVTILEQFPGSLVESATPTNHGNIWALKCMKDYVADWTSLDVTRRVPIIHVSYDLMTPDPGSVEEVYLRLMTQSLCKTMPGKESLIVPGKAFDWLTNVVWCSEGVFTLDDFDRLADHWVADGNGILEPLLQDKLPRLLDYVRPKGVRIADGNRVRLGAHLAPGTTIMHEGFANFNAATLGKCMIEGRISAGVTIGEDTDVGGGVSIMGTMSGGNNVVISVGKQCLLEAECILGIPIGDRVRVEAGLPLKSTMPVRVSGTAQEWCRSRQTSGKLQDLLRQISYRDGNAGVNKALHLAGINDAIFRRNALDGAMEVIPRGDRIWGSLTPELHAN